MPELPEVETLRKTLQPVLCGRRIRAVKMYHNKLTKSSPFPITRSVGASIRRISRRAKILLLELNNGYTLCVHLKMTGQLVYKNRRGDIRVGGHPIAGSLEDLPNTFTAATWSFTDDSWLYFNDQRKFAYLHCRKTAELQDWLDSLRLGPEPFTPALSQSIFLQRLRSHPRLRIKDALLKQSIVAGLGNIYADEVNFAARVHPARRVISLSEKEIILLYRAILSIIKLAVKKNGTTFHQFGQGKGMGGTMQKYLRVYGREDEACHRCASKIIRKKLGGRSAHFCPKCQIINP